MTGDVSKSRRRFLAAGIGIGLALAGYFAWRYFQKPSPPKKVVPKITPTVGEEKDKDEEFEVELEQYPDNSPLGHSFPFLRIKPVSGTQNGNAVTVKLLCLNEGGAASSAVLEVYKMTSFSFPLNLSELPVLTRRVVYLSAGTSMPLTLNFSVTTSTLGFLFVLSDPILDSCPRSYGSLEEMKAFQRHFAYFGR